MMPLLSTQRWKTSYRNEEDDLVEAFYIPALSCAVQYDRTTGYFTADALALAARGLERLIANEGRMRLIVGCALGPEEVAEAERGYDLREKIARKLCAVDLTPPDFEARRGLECLAWLIATGRLDIKVAVPVDASGRPVPREGIFHEKVGIITDAEGNRIAFSGSVNETEGGWRQNRESFHVHCSWEGGRDARHVEDEVQAFAKLWEGRTRHTWVVDLPQAVRERLLEFLPREDRFSAVAPAPKEKAPQGVSPEELRRIVWSYIREAPRLWNGIRVGEVTAAVRPWPHQIRAYKRLLDSWPCQTLLADEVGLGKTITAGLLIRQVWLAGRARRILILAPKGILSQWQNELAEKFNLNVPIYDGEVLRWKRTYGFRGPEEKEVARDSWHQEPFVIASSQLVRREDRAKDLEGAEPWDLLVLDEAHHARRRAPGSPQEGGPNKLLRLLRHLREKAKALLLLTATPMQIHPVELWDLLRLLGLPEAWAKDRNLFLRYFELAQGDPNQEEFGFLAEEFRRIEAAYGEVSEGEVGGTAPALSPVARRKVLRALRDRSGIPWKRLKPAERMVALGVLRRFSPIRRLMIRHTRNLLREYHARGLLETPIAKRCVRDVPVRMTTPERDLYEAVEDYISTTYNKASKEKRSAVGFVMTSYRRRLASSFYALQRTLNRRLEALARESAIEEEEEDLSDDETADEVLDAAEARELALEALRAEERAGIEDLLRRIAQVGANTKARRLVEELEAAFGEGYDSAIVFTHYTDTMDYLKEELAAAFPDRPIACYSGRGLGGELRDRGGEWRETSREEVKRRLKAGKIQLLVCTDAAAEGLNLQYCGVLVNYDLPWNPMKVEQRIGRIDRIGQKYPEVRVVNLAYEDTVEADVYFALQERIRLFEGFVGKLQPILSQLPKKIESVVLEPRERREQARARLRSEILKRVEEVEERGFDMDEVAGRALEPPEMPPPALTLEEIDEALQVPGVLPPGWTLRRLDRGSYALSGPGFSEEIRVTTNAEVFEDHAESHEFLSPGGRTFEELAAGALSGSRDAEVGRVWLDEKKGEVFVLTGDGERRVGNLRELLAAIREAGDSRQPGAEGEGSEFRCLG